MTTSLMDLAKAFNALPRPTSAAARRAAKTWTFNITYWHIEPNPCHVLLLFQRETDVAHMTRLPLSLPSDEPGYAYFPETAQAAAPEIVRGILQFFINPRYTDMHGNENLRPSIPGQFNTTDESLAHAVGAELGRLGIWPPSLHTVDISLTIEKLLLLSHFSDLFKVEVDRKIQESNYLQKPHILTPVQIRFDGLKQSPIMSDEGAEGQSDEEKHNTWVGAYDKLLHSVTPPDGTCTRGPVACRSKQLRCLRISKVLREVPTPQVKLAADSGRADAAVDYGIRLLHGINCDANRDLARQYFLKAALSDTASEKERAIAHGLLCEWYWAGCSLPSSENLSRRYPFAACHHANKSAELYKRISPAGAPSSTSVLTSLASITQPDIRNNDARLFYPHALRAYEEHELQEEEARRQLVKKRHKNLNRYRCAAEDCDIETDSGHMLYQCAGPCDNDEKPSYCGRACQKHDWSIHKSFCRAGAPCSVTKQDTFEDMIASNAPARESGSGLFFLPMIHFDGSATLLASGTLEPDDLYQLKAELLDQGRNPGPFYLFDRVKQ